MTTTLLLGNPAPQMTLTEGGDLSADGALASALTRQVLAPHIFQSVTRVDMRDGFDDADAVDLTLSTGNDRILALVAEALGASNRRYAVGVYEVENLMSVHSAGVAPTWVDCPDDPGFAAALGQHFSCPVGQPMALLTNAGRDAIHAQMVGTSAQPAAANYIALTANSATPAAGDTTLAGEITTAGGGLIRAQATYAHTAGTNTSTLTRTFTANGTDALPVTLAKIGVFNGTGAVTMMFESLLNATATLNVSGDSMVLTETITAG